MKALLLAAGLGTRLRPITDHTPKCLVPIHGKPLIEYWLDNLTQAGSGPFLINLHFKANLVEDYLHGSRYINDICTVYEKELLGTGGTLVKNREFFANESFMLIHADNLCLCDFKAFEQGHFNRPAGTEITMMTFTTTSPKSCGIVELDKTGVVECFHEKIENPPGNLANGAVYILESSVLQLMASLEKEDLDFSTDILPQYLGKINTWHNNIYHRDIGTLASYAQAQLDMADFFRNEERDFSSSG